MTWQLLLGYLPPTRSDWQDTRALRRQEYSSFCKDFMLKPDLRAAAGHDHPLSDEQDSEWNKYFKELEEMEQIERDVDRTHQELPFFGGTDSAAKQHRDEMKRVLFVFAKLNPGLNYVQGMNEMLAPLYYVFSTDAEDAEAAAAAEADAFFCLVKLMTVSENRDLYCKALDRTNTGVQATMQAFLRKLAVADPAICAHLQREKVDPHFFAFRWITVLFCQDIERLADLLRTWDYLLGDEEGCKDALLRLCSAMLLRNRTELMAAEFPEIVKILQGCGKGAGWDVEDVLGIAMSLSPRYML